MFWCGSKRSTRRLENVLLSPHLAVLRGLFRAGSSRCSRDLSAAGHRAYPDRARPSAFHALPACCSFPARQAARDGHRLYPCAQLTLGRRDPRLHPCSFTADRGNDCPEHRLSRRRAVAGRCRPQACRSDYPWLLAFASDFCTASALPARWRRWAFRHGEIPAALFAFNIGVELGQLAFVLAVIALRRLLRRPLQRLPTGAWRVPACLRHRRSGSILGPRAGEPVRLLALERAALEPLDPARHRRRPSPRRAERACAPDPTGSRRGSRRSARRGGSGTASATGFVAHARATARTARG